MEGMYYLHISMVGLCSLPYVKVYDFVRLCRHRNESSLPNDENDIVIVHQNLDDKKYHSPSWWQYWV